MRKMLGGWWRLWIVAIPIWWAVCLWQHKIYVDRECVPLIGLNAFDAFSDCFTTSRNGWTAGAILGPLFLLLVIAAGRWVARGFSREQSNDAG